VKLTARLKKEVRVFFMVDLGYVKEYLKELV
jgi:hypothetical protein